jgi:predicted phage terminase large subunit-like protein
MSTVSPLEYNAILRSDLHAFARKCFVELNPATIFKDNWHIEAITHALEQVIAGRTKRLIMNIPPRSLKSFISSVVVPAFLLGKNPTLKIICVSYSQELADKFSTDFRRIIESDWYKRLFPTLRLPKNSENEVQTTLGGFRYATSIGGTLTGRGGDIFIIDDPLSATEAHRKSSRDSVNSWFSSTLLSRLDDPAESAIILVMQRLHPDDLTGHLVAQGGWEQLCLPAIAPDDRVIPLSNARVHRVYCWRKGELLHPERLTWKVLEERKRKLGTDDFNAQYLQAPLPERGLMLKRHWLKKFAMLPTKQPGDRIVQSWDTAAKATSTADYSACLTFLVRNKNEFYFVDALRIRLEFPDLSNLVITHARKHQANEILIEESNSGIPLIQWVKRHGLQGVIGIKPVKDKITRMMGQTPKLEAGSLVIPESAPWLDDFLTEYLTFWKGHHDDQIDCLSQFLARQGSDDDNIFEFDFGHDDATSLGPTEERMLYLLGRI